MLYHVLRSGRGMCGKLKKDMLIGVQSLDESRDRFLGEINSASMAGNE